jgi:catechol 2,3-dioxygenase-like lactoylglutathione lyase family enzyme
MSAVLDAATPVAFVAATDLRRARDFYERTLGLTFVREDEFALVFDLTGTALRIARVDRLQPQPFTVLGWRVDDVAAAVHALSAAGVAFKRYPAMEQDEVGVWTSPSGARVAWFEDPDGNVLAVTEY